MTPEKPQHKHAFSHSFHPPMLLPTTPIDNDMLPQAQKQTVNDLGRTIYTVQTDVKLRRVSSGDTRMNGQKNPTMGSGSGNGTEGVVVSIFFQLQ